MDVDELLNADRELTDEELAFLEQTALEHARKLQEFTIELIDMVEEQDPELAGKLKRSTDNLVSSLEQAAAIPWPHQQEQK